MTIRSDLLTAITAAVTGTSVSTSTELPWVTGGVPLHQKNMKKIYLDSEQYNIEQLHTTLDGNDVSRRETVVTAYLTVDAKNQPLDIDTIISAVIGTKETIVDCYIRQCDLSSTIEEDRITYTFEFRLFRINN